MKLYSIHRGQSGKFELSEYVGDVRSVVAARRKIAGMFVAADVVEMSRPHTRTSCAIARLVGAKSGWWFSANPYAPGTCTIHHKGDLPAFFLATK